jgi:hypothetical protein
MDFNEKQLMQISRAKEVLQNDESVLDVTNGIIEVHRLGRSAKRNGVVLVTDRRVILYSKKLGGYEMNDHVYGLLTALDYKKSVMYGSLTLAAAGDRTHVSRVPTADIERVAKSIRIQMAATHSSGFGGMGGPGVGSPADEVRKLAELNRDGIITDAEFSAKKQQLLGL